MGKLNSLLLGLLSGAGFMYFYDPEMGNRRRALARDRVISVRNSSDDALETAITDLRNRAYGVASEVAGRFSGEKPSNWVLKERIRSQLGALTTHPSAIQVDVQGDTAYLSGHILQNEVDRLLAGVKKVSGISRVENQLQAHETAGNIPELQGEGKLAMSGGQWSPSSRLLASAGGAFLWLYGSLRGGFTGTFIKWGGLLLALRGLTNKNVKSIVGVGMGEQGGLIDIRKSVNINAPVEEVYGMWENFENFSRFMSHIKEIRNTGGGRSHWVVEGPAGTSVEFDAMETERIPNELIAWETVPESTVKHKGRVRFTRQGDRTRVQVWMTYVPPAGALGHAVATLFGTDPKSAMDEDLVRLKSLLETGVTTSDSQKVRRGDAYGQG